MDPVSFVASVLGITSAVTATVTGVRHIARIWKEAPAEVSTLVARLDSIKGLLEATQKRPHEEVDPFLSNAISRVQKSASDLHNIVQVKIMNGNPDCSRRAVRKAWRKHRDEISRLNASLSEAQSYLGLALIVSYQSRFNWMEGALRAQVPGTGVQIALPQPTTPSSLTANSFRSEPNYLATPLLEVTWPSGEGIRVSQHDEESSTGSEKYPIHARRPGPASLLERSANFVPETYTMEGAASLVFYDSQEKSLSGMYREVDFTLLILHRRQFTRVSLKMMVTSDSPYWRILRAKPAKIGYRNVNEPPATLTNALDIFLRNHETLPQDSQITLDLGHNQGEFKIHRKSLQGRKTQQYLQQISAEARHMRFPRYKDKELAHMSTFRKYEAVRLQAKVKSGWVIEVRFGAREDHMDEEWYALQILYSLRWSNRFGPLVGILEDENGETSGYLCRNPSQGPLLSVIDRAKQDGTPVNWARRERWCRQIIEGVSELHGSRFRHGSLGRFLRNGLYLDDCDNVIFLNSFRHSFTNANDHEDLSLPPEWHIEADEADHSAPAIPVLPTTDVYQLGLLLWCIAANEQFLVRSMLCERMGCPNSGNGNCIALHAQLPSVDGATAPSFMDRVIALCRAESPSERPPVWRLLEEFPSTADPGRPRIRELAADDDAEMAEELVAWKFNIRCYRCQVPTADRYYHCGHCLGTLSYNICPKCFSDGHHCLDDDHYLQVLREKEPQGTYYSCVGDDGQRQALTC